MNYLNFTAGLVGEKRLVFDMRFKKRFEECHGTTTTPKENKKSKNNLIDLHLRNLFSNCIHATLNENASNLPELFLPKMLHDFHFVHEENHETVVDRIHFAKEHHSRSTLTIIKSIQKICKRVMGLHHESHERHKHAAKLHAIIEDIRLSINNTSEGHLSHINDPHDLIDELHSNLDKMQLREKMKMHYPEMFDSDQLVSLETLEGSFIHKPIFNGHEMANLVDIGSGGTQITPELISKLDNLGITEIPLSYIGATVNMFIGANDETDVAERLRNVHLTVGEVQKQLDKIPIKEARKGLEKHLIIGVKKLIEEGKFNGIGIEENCMKAFNALKEELMHGANFENLAKILYLNTRHHPNSFYHSMEAGIKSFISGEKLGKTEVEKKGFMFTGLLHDVGKIGIPNAILEKPGRPTDTEFRIIQTHPLIGFLILINKEKNIDLNNLLSNPIIFAAFGIFLHHDDLSGFSKEAYGLTTHGKYVDTPLPALNELPKPILEAAKIVQTQDNIAAVIEKRPYKGDISKPDALMILNYNLKEGKMPVGAYYREYIEMVRSDEKTLFPKNLQVNLTRPMRSKFGLNGRHFAGVVVNETGEKFGGRFKIVDTSSEDNPTVKGLNDVYLDFSQDLKFPWSDVPKSEIDFDEYDVAA